MTRTLSAWLSRRWRPQDAQQLVWDYQEVFSSAAGQRILQHWMDSVYCTTYEGTDVPALWMHTGRRAFVQEVLENLDAAGSPDPSRVG